MSDTHPAIKFLLDNGKSVQGSSFLSDVRRKYIRFGTLSEKQIAAVERFISGEARRQDDDAKRAALLASGVKAPEGVHRVCGTIVSVKESAYGFGALVTDDAGYRVWFRLPASLTRDCSPFDAKGRRVSFDATLTRSEDDPLFAFAKRPKDAKFLAASL